MKVETKKIVTLNENERDLIQGFYEFMYDFCNEANLTCACCPFKGMCNGLDYIEKFIEMFESGTLHITIE